MRMLMAVEIRLHPWTSALPANQIIHCKCYKVGCGFVIKLPSSTSPHIFFHYQISRYQSKSAPKQKFKQRSTSLRIWSLWIGQLRGWTIWHRSVRADGTKPGPSCPSEYHSSKIKYCNQLECPHQVVNFYPPLKWLYSYCIITVSFCHAQQHQTRTCSENMQSQLNLVYIDGKGPFLQTELLQGTFSSWELTSQCQLFLASSFRSPVSMPAFAANMEYQVWPRLMGSVRSLFRKTHLTLLKWYTYKLGSCTYMLMFCQPPTSDKR